MAVTGEWKSSLRQTGKTGVPGQTEGSPHRKRKKLLDRRRSPHRPPDTITTNLSTPPPSFRASPPCSLFSPSLPKPSHQTHKSPPTLSIHSTFARLIRT